MCKTSPFYLFFSFLTGGNDQCGGGAITEMDSLYGCLPSKWKLAGGIGGEAGVQLLRSETYRGSVSVIALLHWSLSPVSHVAQAPLLNWWDTDPRTGETVVSPYWGPLQQAHVRKCWGNKHFKAVVNFACLFNLQVRLTCRYSKHLLNVHSFPVMSLAHAHYALNERYAIHLECWSHDSNAHSWECRHRGSAKRPGLADLEGRSGEDGSPVSDESVPLEGFILRQVFHNIIC